MRDCLVVHNDWCRGTPLESNRWLSTRQFAPRTRTAMLLGKRLPRRSLESSRSDREFDACVVGIGRLGLCFALTLERTGLNVVGVDVNESLVRTIAEKKYSSEEPGLDESLAEAERLLVTTDLRRAVTASNFVFVLVATPTDGGKYYYDHSALSNLFVQLNSFELCDVDIIICSTVFPGYIRNIGLPLLRDCTDVSLSYNPAFVAQGDVMSGYQTGGWFGLVVIGAANDRVSQSLREIYERIAGGMGNNTERTNICVMSPESAEICKLASNCFRTTKIAFANMIGDIADRTPGANKFEICNALKSDRSIGPICMTPGYGFGGPCYPRDNKAFAIYAAQLGVKALIPVATDDYNDFHHKLMACQLDEQTQDEQSEIVFRDVTYKPRCALAMIDNSPKLEVARQLVQKGRKVKIVDRFEVIQEVMKEFGSLFNYETIDSREYEQMLESDSPRGTY